MIDQCVGIHDLVPVSDYSYEISKKYRSDMRVDACVFADKNILTDILEDRSLDQLVNVATLPGIQGKALAMPDIHQGYGFPIGGVAAMCVDSGVISPGGIGYDINCGVRLLTTNLTVDAVQNKLSDLAHTLYRAVPSGVGFGGKLFFEGAKLDDILRYGAPHMFSLGIGTEDDLVNCEEGGCLAIADASKVSDRAKRRGADQLGTLGSGNHFLELQRVDEIFDESVARVFGLFKNQLVVMIHCGSRGLGHQVCTDYVRSMLARFSDWGIVLPDRELACAPFNSPEGQDYFKAMSAAANFAWANRHTIGHLVRIEFQKLFGSQMQVKTLYDVSHNIGKIEKHTINGKQKVVIVHRKGATRAFGPQRAEIPSAYRDVGQPVLIPGTMGTSSYVLAGTAQAMNVSLGSTCHGAGRRMSRSAALKTIKGSALRKYLESRGIIIKCSSDNGLAEEAPDAYKEIDNVVNVVVAADIAKKVAKLKPLAVVKG